MNTADNPADCATRPSQATSLIESTWIHGSNQIPIGNITDSQDSFPLVSPEEDKELHPEVGVLDKRVTPEPKLRSHRFERFSEWRRLVTAMEVLLHVSQSYSGKCQCKGWHLCSDSKSVPSKIKAEQLVRKYCRFNSQVKFTSEVVF